MKSAEKLNLTRSMELITAGKETTPGGMLGIRRPYNFVEGEYPIFIEKGYDGHIVDVDGNDYIDMLCSYGPIILGYVEEEINKAVIDRMSNGFCFSLVQEIQNKLETEPETIASSILKSLEANGICDMTVIASNISTNSVKELKRTMADKVKKAQVSSNPGARPEQQEIITEKPWLKQ
jgi:acetylornithine/succinyldiaminopimelate/putrescine aminotransferase